MKKNIYSKLFAEERKINIFRLDFTNLEKIKKKKKRRKENRNQN